ncbi:hypothetical protein [Pedobacter insulae]|uniref:Uncharacterized protein n=1 Tax=Pedobacter insulae TaxID=414048 RepID=A0A1I2WS13_9SPHI|nr:hypothetical protein [Pedobacter insulae]SFH04158.1 hypothetical protein SAMN04489864_104251 [Pedobacter insulae]
MKHFKKLALLILFLLLIPIVLLYINIQKAARLDAHYMAALQGMHSEPFVIDELNIPGKKLVLQSSAASAGSLQKAEGLGYLHYDTLKKQIIISSEENVRGEGGSSGMDKMVHFSYFSLEGKLMDHKSARHRVDDAGLGNSILLKNWILPFQKWKDEGQEIFLRIGNDTLKFKLPVKKGEIFLTEKHSYRTDLAYYKLPSALNKEFPTFLLYQPQNGRERLFIIKNRDK